MKFTTRAFIRKNTPELQKKLKDIGYDICPCCNFDNAVWLVNLTQNGSIHGIGYSDETMPMTVTEALYLYVAETNAIDCGEDEELFIKLVSEKDE